MESKNIFVILRLQKIMSYVMSNRKKIKKVVDNHIICDIIRRMNMYHIIFYQKENGTIPVQEFLDALSVRHCAKALREIDILEEYGRKLTLPYVKHIKNKLWELRIKSGSEISRIFYFVSVGDDIVLLHGFLKKTQRTPNREMKTAKTYLEDYERRNNL